ncbi:MAG: glycosyltransferase [Parcubacteria group bacterium]
MKKKILHLITGLELGGGAENMLLQLLPEMQEELDNRICVIKGRGEIGKKLENLGIPVYYLDLKSIFDFGMIFRYNKVLKDFNPDVQVNYLIHADIFGRIFGKIFGVKKIVPYIRNIHKGKKFLLFLDKITLFLADFVLTNSEASRKYYIEKMGFKKEKTMCIPNGINLSRFENLNVDVAEKKKEIGIPENSLVIGCVARMEKQKDIPTLAKAFKLVKEKHGNAVLLLVGHGSEKENIKNFAKEIGIEKEVFFLEKRTDVPELLQIMDIFVLPSLNEGMSNALLEAMASKKLIITSDIEENKELIENEKEGLNFEAGNLVDLAEKINGCMNNLNEANNFKNDAFRKVINKYDLHIIKENYKIFLLNQ